MKVLRSLLLCTFFALVVVGCKTSTSDSDNAAEVPWNSQKGWEHGLPTGINQGR
jgi:hypothetical protein